LMSDRPSHTWAFVTGLLGYALASLIPLIGMLVMVVTMVAGLGAMLIAKKELVVMLREQRVV